MNWKRDKLLNGESIISKESGNSMLPLIRSKQPVRLSPCKLEDIVVGDIVYCKVRGNFYTHLVLQVDAVKGCLIGNNKGRTNGWTKQVYGKVTEILEK